MSGKGEAAGCNQTCGCPYPCPAPHSCRCATRIRTIPIQHVYCKCGDHCGCNPCECAKTEVSGTDELTCTCGPGCTCESETCRHAA
ncbi:hypothetical protein AMTRI_Chr09g33910 [Amborella trichopoda]